MQSIIKSLLTKELSSVLQMSFNVAVVGHLLRQGKESQRVAAATEKAKGQQMFI